VKRIYLEQWVWVRLAQVALGGPASPIWADPLDLAREAVRFGNASFPLSSCHYMELAKVSLRQRHEVGTTMLELSAGHRIVGPVPALGHAEGRSRLSTGGSCTTAGALLYRARSSMGAARHSGR
jgi:hypothetical protein